MEPERWRRVEDLYHAAMERDVSQRSVFLAEACSRDEDLRAEVESLLAADAGEGSLERPAWDGAEGLLEATGTALAPGAELGPYQVLGPLGAGGMGQVYRARDSRLGRSVAIKVAGRQFSGRFDREARAISALNHPHICTLYDVGPNYLVMELVEGQTLAAILRKGPLPMELAIRYGAQIADALATAHALGIFHRDLKPANVMVTRNGVKVLDFGLAKISAIAGGGQSPETTLTDKHQIIGTPAYMAPEQLEGKPCDARTDLFALGLVLYEMATGKRAFAADSQAALIAQIMSSAPLQMEKLPAQFAHVVERCVARDSGARWQSATDLKMELEWAAKVQPAAPPARIARRRWAWAAAALACALILSLAATFYFRQGPAAQTAVIEFSIPLPENTETRSLAVSPDGRYLAATAGSASAGGSSLWVRPLDSRIWQPVPDSDGEYRAVPFWSPDSRFIGFFSQGKLKRIGIGAGSISGVPQIICDTTALRGTWSRHNVILLDDKGLYKVPAEGGTPVPVKFTADNSTRGRKFPIFLPDGNRFLVFGNVSRGSINGFDLYLASLDFEQPRRLLENIQNMALTPGSPDGRGYLLFVRSENRTVLAQAFDYVRGQLEGEQFAVAELGGPGPPFTASATGLLAYGRSDIAEPLQLTWFDRNGREVGRVGDPGDYRQLALSPDQKSVVVVLGDTPPHTSLWVLRLEGGANLRLASNPGFNSYPVWSLNSRSIAWSSRRFTEYIGDNIYLKSSDGASEEKLLLKTGKRNRPMDWHPKEHFLIYESTDEDKDHLWLLPVTGERKPVRLLPQSKHNDVSAQFSPDGRWIAYVSDETGMNQVYVRRFPISGAPWQISTAGGNVPRWRRDGNELYFLGADSKIMAVAISAGSTFQASPSQELFQIALGRNSSRSYGVTTDGQRFLMITSDHQPSVTIVTNWPARLKK